MTPERFRQIDALVSRVLQRDPRDRDAFLHEACADDGELRREVESLLAADEASGTFLDRPAAQLVAGGLSDGTAGQAEEAGGAPGPPRAVGRYLVQRQLGSGGMGSVYAAYDPELGRRIAIKLIRPEPGRADPTRRRARLLREAQALARVAHPNVIAIHDVGTFDAQVFIAMEYVEGATLTAWLAAERRSCAEIVRMFVQAGRGLAAAHAQGIVHRDFKPDNVWIGEDGRARVLDFGLARPTSAALDEDLPGPKARTREPPAASAGPAMLGARLTEPGRFLGTPAYMAPEQREGKPIDARTDQFSFCVALHEAIHGELPSGSAGGAVLGAIEQRRSREGRGARRVPARLRRALRRGLSPDPADRFDSMDRLLDALERRPVAARRGALAAGALALLATLALIGRAERGGGDRPAAPRVRALAVLPLEPLAAGSGEAPEVFAAEITDALTTALAQSSALRVISRTSVARYAGRNLPLSRIARELNVDAVVEGTVARAGERVRVSVHLVDARSDRQLWAESYERDLRDVPALQGEIARAVADRIRLPLPPGARSRLAAARKVDPVAYEAYARGRYFWNKRTAEGFQKALACFNEAIARDPGYALAYAALGDTYDLLAMYDLSPSEEALPKTRKAAMRALELDDGLAEAHTSLARYYENYDRDWPAAEREYRRAIELNPGYATGHDWYSTFLSAQGRHDEALAEASKAHELDPFSLTINTSLGMALSEAGREEPGIERLRDTIEMDPNFGYAHFQLGRTYLRTRAFAGAIAEFRKASALSPTMPRYASALANAYGRAGRNAEALQILRELEHGPGRSKVSWTDVAIVRAGLGQDDQAFAALDRALAHREWRLVRIDVEPMFDPLRKDPRFAELLRRIGLPR